jgi:hypothetical protein
VGLPSIRFIRRAALVSGVVSILAVALAIPGRWEGRRTAEEAWVPLRPVSVEEAVVLLGVRGEHERSTITALTEDWVYLGTSYYLLPAAGPPGKKPIEGWEVSHGRQRYAMHSASWEPYYLVHRLPRRDLETALGRPLSATDVDGGVFQDWRVSYRSYQLWWYAAVEVLLMTGFLVALAVCFRVVRHPLLIVPILLAAGAGLFIVGRWYAPALWDADMFYQRILFDRLSLSGLLLLWLGNPVVVLGASLGLYAVDRIGRRLGSPGDVAWSVWRRIAGAFVVISVVALVLGDYLEYRRERESARARIAEAAGALSPERLSTLMRWASVGGARVPHHVNLHQGRRGPGPVGEEVEAVLGSVRLGRAERLTVIIPAGRYDAYMTVANGGAWRWVDLRQSAPLSAWHFGAETVASGDFSRGYLTHPCRAHVAGRVVRAASGDVGALITLEYAWEYRPSLLRQLCRVVWWGD